DQAYAMAKFLKKFQIKRIACSPLMRAFATAHIVGAEANVVPQETRDLFPWRLGIFTGLPKKDNQEALRLFVQSPLVSIPNGESLDDFEGRQFAFWAPALQASHTSSGLDLFVCHTSNVTALVNFTEGADNVEPEFGDSVKPGGVGAIYWDGKKHRVEPIFGEEEKAQFGGS
ncbi:MAG: histidine phosphatase family protein, partial [Patescibacteria group bacterium]|nr:histidine phosphatase family protein [Patescibacteria group bacterium]